MKNISQEELNKILRDHKLWLKGEGGKRADLSYTNLRCANLSNANLSNANLEYVKTNIYTIGYNLACTEK